MQQRRQLSSRSSEDTDADEEVDARQENDRFSSPPPPAPNPLSAYSSENMVPFNDVLSSARSGRSRYKGTNTHTLHVHSTSNNVILTYSDDSKGGPVFGSISGGLDRVFKKANRGTYEASHQAALKMFRRIEQHGEARIIVAFKGLWGSGRQAVAAALASRDGQTLRRWIIRVEDRTPIKVGGTRPRKARRL